MGPSDKALLASASLIADAARSLDEFVAKFDSIAEQQAAVFDRLSDKLDKMGSVGSSSGGGDNKSHKALGGLTKGFRGLTDSLKTLGESGRAIKDGFQALNEGLKDLLKSIKTYHKIPKQAVHSLTEFLKDIAQEFGELDQKKMKEGSESIRMMSESLVVFGLTLIFATAAFAIGAVGSLVIIPIIASYAYLFAKIGDKKIVNRIDNGAVALFHMGLGLLSFSLGLFAVKELAGGKWSEFAEGSLIVMLGATLFAGLFYLLGGKEFSTRVEQGSKALIFTGIALASLALGIFAFQLLNIGLVPVLMAGLSVLTVGLAFGIIGEFSTEIEEGSIAMIFSGIALASLALGLWIFQKLDINLKTVLVAGLAVLTFGLLFGLIGMAASEVVLGILVMVGASIAIYALGYGINKFKENKIDLTDIGVISAVVLALGTVFGIAGVASPFIAAGAASLVVAGYALSTLAKGLTDFKGIKYTDDDAAMISKVIGSLAGAFAQAGGSKGTTGGGWLGAITGIDLSPNETKRGIDSMLHAGDALSSMASGLVNFKKLKLGDDADLWKSVVLVVTGLGQAFASMGGKGLHKRGGLLGLIGLETNDVEQGIAGSMKAGDTLKSIASGLEAFRKLKLGKDEAVDLWGDGTVANPGKIGLVIAGISSAFGTIGSKNRASQKGSLLGWFGYEHNAVEDGISAVKGVGKELNDIAAGVTTFSKMKFDMNSVSANIGLVLGAISNAFGSIGSGKLVSTGLMGSIFGAKDPVVKVGIDAVKGVGQELVTIAKGVSDFAALKFTDPITGKVVLITPGMFGPKGTISTNIDAVVSSVASVFAKIGTEQKVGGGWFSKGENPVAVGIKAVSGIGDELSKIAAGVQVFANIKDLNATKNAIFDLITLVPNAFLTAYNKYLILIPDAALKKIKDFDSLLADYVGVFKDIPDNLGKKSSSLTDTFSSVFNGLSTFANMKLGNTGQVISYIERLAATADPLTKLANSFERIAKSMDKFSGIFGKMDSKAVKTSDMLIQSLVTFAKVDPNSFNTLSDKGAALIKFIYEKGAASTNTITPPTVGAPLTAGHQAGHIPVPPAPTHTKSAPAPAAPSKETLANQQMMMTMSQNMADMATALRDIKLILSGTLTVKQIAY